MKISEPSVPFFGTRHLGSNRQSGFAMAEAMMGAALVALMISCLFATNAHLLSLLRQGKQSTYATQMIAERVEQMRTCPWETLIQPARLQVFAKGATATSAVLPGATETFTVEPYPNPANVRIVCVRAPDGTVTPSGSDLTAETVKVSVDVQWKTGKRQRERQYATVMTSAGI